MSVEVGSAEVAWGVAAVAVAMAMAVTVAVDAAVVAAAEAAVLVGWAVVAAAMQETVAEGRVEAEEVGKEGVGVLARAAVAAVPREVATWEEALRVVGVLAAAMTAAWVARRVVRVAVAVPTAEVSTAEATEAAPRVAVVRAAEAVRAVTVGGPVVVTAAAPKVAVMMAAVVTVEAATAAAVTEEAAECSLLRVRRCCSPWSCRRRRRHCGRAPCTSTCSGPTGQGAARALQPRGGVGLGSSASCDTKWLAIRCSGMQLRSMQGRPAVALVPRA